MAVRTLSARAEPAVGSRSLVRIYLTRGVLALLWAAVFGAMSGSLHAGAIAFLIAYPALDVVASLVDAREHPKSVERRIQLANAGLSAAAVIGVSVASTHDIAAVLRIFGSWAVVSGLVQLGLALRRRSTVGWQPAILFSGGLSAFAGLNLIAKGGHTNPQLDNITGYAAFGGFLFVLSAGLTVWTARRAGVVRT